MTGLADQAARDRIAGDLDTTLVVEAAAGTGKTSELIRRIVALVATGRTTLERIVAVTFTDAAAGELKLRLRAAIEERRGDPALDPGARSRLTAALPALEEVRIGTIHAFCADLLRERPVEAGVDPAFEVAAEEVAGDLRDLAFDRWFEQQLAAPGDAMRRVLARTASGRDGPRQRLRAAARELIEWRDFQMPWRHVPFDRDTEMQGLVAEMAALGALSEAGERDDFLTRSLGALRTLAENVARRAAVRGSDPDGLEAALVQARSDRHWTWTGRPRARHRFDRAEVIARRTELATRLDAFIARTGADLAPAVREALWEVVVDYEERKQRAGVLDFLDLLLAARRLVRDGGEVRAALQQRFTHLLVDEFQDTDPLQAEILLLLAADDPAVSDWRSARVGAGRLFVVGDPKQSIYRFRRADVALYESVKRQLVNSGADVVALTVSFRAVPAIQAAVNVAFGPVMDGRSTSQATYVPLSPYRPLETGQPALVVVPIPYPYGDWGRVINQAVDDSTPHALAAFVHWLVHDSGWTVTERERPGERIAVAARHVCLLFRRFTSLGRDVSRPYVRALEAHKVPHVLLGGGAFYDREEIAVVRNALAAIERPDDELLVFATLRGPLFAFADGTLLAYREAVGGLHPLRAAASDLAPPLAEVRDALAILADLHRGRNRQPFGQTITRLLAAVRAHAAFAVWPTGEQALASLARLLDLARRAERRDTGSFRSFVERFGAAETREAPILEEGTAGVRIMTVHRAKGLEFPVVILADPSCRDAPTEATRWIDGAHGRCAMRLAGTAPVELLEHAGEELDREREEAARILYVAATRARDLLVVPAVADGPHHGWLTPLFPVLYPPADRAGTPRARRVPGCPEFGDDATPGRPPGRLPPAGAVAPGLHMPAAGVHDVVWWDPTRLTLDVEESGGIRQQRLLAVDEGGVRAEAGVAAHAAWRADRARVQAAASAVAVRTVTVTELAERGEIAPEVGIPIEIATVEIAPDRPRGKVFGTLVHGVLATVDLSADRAAIERVAAGEARLLGAPPDHAAAAATAVERALAHPIVRQAAAAVRDGECRRETPISLPLADGRLVEGVVDLAFRPAGAQASWTVVDWKTDADVEARIAEYRRQVALYATAIGQATGTPVRAVLLRV